MLQGILAKDKQSVKTGRPAGSAEKKTEEIETSGEKPLKFIVVTEDGSGAGFARMLASGTTGRGNPRLEDNTEVILARIPKEDEEKLKEFELVNKNITPTMDFSEIFKNREKYRDWMFIWDFNHNPEMVETLRSEGFDVFGGGQLTYDMEHDRAFGISLVEQAGMPILPFEEFSSNADALSFLDENCEIAYVFKPDIPDDESWVTMCPDNDNDAKANREIYDFLASQPDKGEFILQERKKGVEINVEYFVYKGTPFFAQANFECKIKYAGDLGKMVGCAQDTCFKIPVDSKIMVDSVAKLLELDEFKDYTGFLDMNLIICDNEYWFLEFCGRWGYNAHCNLFLSVAISPLSEILTDWMSGNIENFDRHFRDGFGASVSAFIDKPVTGLPLTFDDCMDESRFYTYDVYKESPDDDKYKLAGYAKEVGISIAHDYDLKSACDEAIDRFKRIHYPGRCGRLDLNRTDYHSNPLERHQACKEMKMFLPRA